MHTVLFYASTDSLADPVVQLGMPSTLILQFDQLDSDAHSLHYTFEHCDAQWQSSELLDVDFLDEQNRFYDNDDYQLSFNTTTDYIHYRIDIPADVIKISGNYYLHVYDENDVLLLTRPFMVFEPLVGIQSRVSRHNSSPASQSISISLFHSSLHSSNPSLDFKVALWQNDRADTWRLIDSPSFLRPGQLIYDDTATLSFEAGNEYRWADNRDLKYPGLNVDHVEFHDPFYHVTLLPCTLPLGYSFHDDFNGRHYIEARHIFDPASYAADYTFVHFAYHAEHYLGPLYVYGELTDWSISNANLMSYDPDEHIYRLALRLKQGIHAFQFLLADKHGNLSSHLTEGSFPETENDYYIAVYFRTISDRYDRLVAFRRHNSKRTINDWVH